MPYDRERYPCRARARLPRDQLEGSVDPAGVAEFQVLTVELVASSLLVEL